MPSLGDEFRAAREARHLSLSDVSERLHIRSVYLKNIEDEDWAAIAAPVYVRGFIRAYARFLGLDPEDAVDRYNDAIGETPATMSGPLYIGPPSSAGPSIWVWLAGAAALFLVGFVGFSYYQFEKGGGGVRHPAAKPIAVATASAAPTSGALVSPAPSVAPTRAVATSNTLVVRVRQDSWLEISVDGSQKLAQIVPAGSEKIYHGKTATVRAGNAGGVDILVNGKDVGILGATGDVVVRTFKLAE